MAGTPPEAKNSTIPHTQITAARTIPVATANNRSVPVLNLWLLNPLKSLLRPRRK